MPVSGLMMGIAGAFDARKHLKKRLLAEENQRNQDLN
jgi:hypothetical protein